MLPPTTLNPLSTTTHCHRLTPSMPSPLWDSTVSPQSNTFKLYPEPNQSFFFLDRLCTYGKLSMKYNHYLSWKHYYYYYHYYIRLLLLPLLLRYEITDQEGYFPISMSLVPCYIDSLFEMDFRNSNSMSYVFLNLYNQNWRNIVAVQPKSSSKNSLNPSFLTSSLPSAAFFAHGCRVKADETNYLHFFICYVVNGCKMCEK